MFLKTCAYIYFKNIILKALVNLIYFKRIHQNGKHVQEHLRDMPFLQKRLQRHIAYDGCRSSI